MAENSRFPVTMIAPEESTDVAFQIEYVRNSPNGNHIAAYSLLHESVLLISREHRREITLVEPPGGLNLSVDSTGNLLAYACSDNQLRIRPLPTNSEAIIEDCPGVLDTRFDMRGRLWTVREDDELIVEVRDGDSWNVIGQCEVEEQGGGADIRPGPNQDSMFVSPYSGQNEQENFLCRLDRGSLTSCLIESMAGEQFVFASPEIESMLTLDHVQCEVASFKSPFDSEYERISWPDYDEDECEDERPGYSGCFVDDDHFLASSSEGRLFLFQISPLAVKREIHVVGHEPVPTGAKFPNLTDVSGFVSDLIYFERYDDRVAAFFAPNYRDPNPRLVTLRLSDILA